MISLIVPCWKNRNAAFAAASRWTDHPLIREVIIAGVQDGAHREPDIFHSRITWCATERAGRGPQLNLGAQIATGEVLLFHHADSILTEEHLEAIASAMRDPELVGGAFYRKFDERHPRLRCLEKFERWHSRAFGTIYGDQSVFVRRSHFFLMGGFAPLPLMEDVEFSARLRRFRQIQLLDPPMKSCARQQIARGAWKVTMRNLLFLILFRCGVAPERLHKWYYNGESAVCPRVRIGVEGVDNVIVRGTMASRDPIDNLVRARSAKRHYE